TSTCGNPIVPRHNASSSEYVRNVPPGPSAPGTSQSALRASAVSSTGTRVSSSNHSVVPAATWCDTAGDQYTAPSAGAPSTVPDARNPVGSPTVNVTA